MVSRNQGIIYGLALWCGLSLLSTCTHTNPPIQHSVNWDDPKTQNLFKVECMDCHSHETRWPWYSYIAPVSFLIEYQVSQGRTHFNVSTKGHPNNAIVKPRFEKEWLNQHHYYWLGNGALNPHEKAMLIDGLHATFLPSSSNSESK